MMNIRSILPPIAYMLLGAVIATIIATKNKHESYKMPNAIAPSHPAVTSNEDPYGDKSLFNFSPDRSYIAFLQDVFKENNRDYDRYYSLQVFDIKNRQEKSIFVGSNKTSGFEWVDNNTIRVYLDAGTGVRAYRDVDIHRTEPDVYDGTDSFWTPDAEYVRKVRSYGEAWSMYHGVKWPED